MTKLLHVSDLHFGVDNVPEQVEAIEELIRTQRYDAVAVSGDLTQRARRKEFEQARVFLDFAKSICRVIAVPGNHDVTWWRAPMRIGSRTWMYSKWRRYLARDIDPVIRLDGVTIVGVNTAHGITPFTLTMRPRDLSVIGDLRDEQIDRVAHEFESRPGDRRAVVMHHNLIAGEISGRYGLKHSAYVLDRLAKIGVDLIMCGHDHQDAVHNIGNTHGGIVVSVAGTTTTRSRGGLPSAVNEIELSATETVVRPRIWDGKREFVPGAEQRFGR